VPRTTPSPWQAQVNTGTLLSQASSVSCASATVCYATAPTANGSGAFLVSVNAGDTWMLRTAPPGESFLEVEGLSCPAVSTCYLATFALGDSEGGQGLWLTHNGGTSWTQLNISSTLLLSYISCRSLDDCVAAGMDEESALALVTTNGGTTWTSHTGPSEAIFNDIACPSASDCYAVGQVNTSEAGDALAARSTNGGVTWASAKLPATPGALVSIACPSSSECVAAGSHDENTGVESLAFATYNAGSTWSAGTIPSKNGPFAGVVCPSTSECVGTTDGPLEGPDQSSGGTTAALLSSNGGRMWRAVALPDRGPVGGIACPTTSACVTSDTSSGPSDRLLTSSNGGSTWAATTEPSGATTFGISCSSTTACAAVGESDTEASTETTSNGSTWHLNPVPNFVALDDVSCVRGTTDCYAIAANAAGDTVFATSPDSGVNWRAGYNFGVPVSPDSLDCGAVGDCYLLMSPSSGTTALEETTTGGGTAAAWRSITVPNGTAQEGALLSCPTTTECVVAELTGEITTTTDSGAKWTVATMPGGIEEVGALSCGATTTCVAIALNTTSSAETLVSTNTGAKFSLGGKISANLFPVALVCGDSSSCELLGALTGTTPTSLATSNTGASWTTQTTPTALVNGAWVTLTCSAAGRCEAASLMTNGTGEIFGLG
jgi:hypothetical protein